MLYNPSARVVWSLANSGISNTLAGAGNSGNWSGATPNAQTPVDLRDVTDVLISISISAVTGTNPTLGVNLDGYDDQGNLISQIIKTAANITGTGMTTLSGGLHASPGIVLPMWGRVSWTVGGTVSPSFTGEICVIGR